MDLGRRLSLLKDSGGFMQLLGNELPPLMPCQQKPETREQRWQPLRSEAAERPPATGELQPTFSHTALLFSTPCCQGYTRRRGDGSVRRRVPS